jgi:predicted O-methyltransferase YrrM
MPPTLLNNALSRWRLLRTALARRFIYTEILAMAREYGQDYRDVVGHLNPFELQRLLGLDPSPSVELPFAALGQASDYDPPQGSTKAHSEGSVARFLAELMVRKKWETAIELGCFTGWTTCHLALAVESLGRGTVHAVDASPLHLELLRANLNRNRLGHRVSSHAGFSLASSLWQCLPEKAHLIFLDTSHSYPETLEEIRFYKSRIAPGGCLALHDGISAAGVRKSIREASSLFRIHTFATEYGNGLTLLFPQTPEAP